MRSTRPQNFLTTFLWALLVLVSSPGVAQTTSSISIEYKNLRKDSSEADLKKLFPKLSCVPASGLEFLDRSCSAGGVVFAGNVVSTLEAALWKKQQRGSLYMLSFKLDGKHEAAVLNALQEKFGAPNKTEGSVKNVMGVRVVQYPAYSWMGLDGEVTLSRESFSSSIDPPIYVKYEWYFTQKDKDERRARIDEVQAQKQKSTLPRIGGKDL